MELVKLIHVTCALISISGFITRLIGQLRQASWLDHKLVKILPHVNDTLLLLAGITLAIQYQFNPFNNEWLLAKIVLLLIYIMLGMLALKKFTTLPTKFFTGLCAVFVFTAMVLLAVYKPQFF